MTLAIPYQGAFLKQAPRSSQLTGGGGKRKRTKSGGVADCQKEKNAPAMESKTNQDSDTIESFRLLRNEGKQKTIMSKCPFPLCQSDP
jgi:hypothetical protein